MSGEWSEIVLNADVAALATVVAEGTDAVRVEVDGLPPLVALLRRARGSAEDIRACARTLLAAGADPDSHTVEWCGEGRRSALFEAVEREDLELIRLLLEAGASPDEDAFYHACEQSDIALLNLLYRPGFEDLVNRKLDFEDVEGLRWFLDRGVDVNSSRCLHHAIARGRGLTIIRMLLDAGADPNLPWDRWDVGRRPLALAARCGHLAAFELLAERGAVAELDEVDAAVLAVARGESTRLPDVPAPVLGVSEDRGYRWILGQFARLGRTEVVRALIDDGSDVDSPGWSGFTPLEEAAMSGRADTVELLLARGADVHHVAFDDEGPTPLDCALWGYRNNRTEDGDYPVTVRLLVRAGGRTAHTRSSGDEAIDALLEEGPGVAR